MAFSSIVIKVKFGETLRRFIASINDKKIVLDIVTLRAKIRSLFNFNSDVDFTLTYVDEDGDSVTLANDDDLQDVVRQGLNPLRLIVTLQKGNPSGYSSTTPMKLPPLKLPSGPFPTVLSEFLKSMPEPLRDQLAKLPHELASKATNSSTPAISELAEKLTTAYMNRISDSVSGGPSTGNVDPETESSNSKNKENVEKTYEGVKSKDVQPPKPMDLNYVNVSHIGVNRSYN